MKRCFIILVYLLVVINVSYGSNNKNYETAEIDIGDGIKMRLVKINPGRFTMGTESMKKRGKPTGTVVITQEFYMGQYEVTQEQYQKIMGKNPSYWQGSKSYADSSKQPVECIQWFDAIRFCNALSKQQGLSIYYTDKNGDSNIKNGEDVICDWSATGFRLPTEAEWEYCCRAGTTTECYWGNSNDVNNVKRYAWFDKNCRGPASNTHELFEIWTNPHAELAGTQAVGQKSPNSWGLYDMNGNATEWCWDWADINYNFFNETGIATDPIGLERNINDRRIVRGASFDDSVDYMTSGGRSNLSWLVNCTGYNNAVGFRVLVCP